MNKLEKGTATTRARYQRIAPVYDLMELLPERRYAPWRRRLWSLVKGLKVLKVGVGDIFKLIVVRKPHGSSQV